jgi:predicted component of type VI protein secretion system
VTEAVSATLPVKPPAGVTVIVDVFPEVAPGARVTAVPLTVKLELTADVTVTAADVPDALL